MQCMYMSLFAVRQFGTPLNYIRSCYRRKTTLINCVSTRDSTPVPMVGQLLHLYPAGFHFSRCLWANSVEARSRHG